MSAWFVDYQIQISAWFVDAESVLLPFLAGTVPVEKQYIVFVKTKFATKVFQKAYLQQAGADWVGVGVDPRSPANRVHPRDGPPIVGASVTAACRAAALSG
jgi:hypothetical protein